MTDLQRADQLISAGDYQAAMALLNAAVDANPDDAEAVFRRGKLAWRLGDRRRAISDYEHASQLDPQSGATAALQLARDVMDFFHSDQLNP